MREYIEIGLNSYGLHIETGLVDLYITPTALTLVIALAVGLRLRKVIKTRKAVK